MRHCIVCACVFLCLAASVAIWFFRRSVPEMSTRVLAMEKGWTVRAIRELPEEVAAIHSQLHAPTNASRVFVGTGPAGGVYCFYLESRGNLHPIGVGLGDQQPGTATINTLGVCDIDGDGTEELLAQTCQILPRRSPRLFVWSLTSPPTLRATTRPDIQSSWSHGLGFVSGSAGTRVFSTFCGYGEVVEYLLRRQERDGFSSDSLFWRKVGQLPVSGEQAESADVDHDGDADLILATGFATSQAAIHVYATDFGTQTPAPKHVIDEGKRFGNVRFLVTPNPSDGRQDLIAWWCTDLSGGACEVIRYRIDASDIASRDLLCHGADVRWPTDSQMAVADLDGDGDRELWFVANEGRLFCCDASQPSRPVCMLQFAVDFSAVEPVVGSDGREQLLIGAGRQILQFRKESEVKKESSLPLFVRSGS